MALLARAESSPLEGVSLTPLHGHNVEAPSVARKKITVLVAGGSHCPILRQYVPTLNKLSRKWKDKDVAFVLVDEADLADTRSFRAEYAAFKLNFPAYLDEKQVLAHRLNLDVTTKVAVLDASGKVLYSGAIDDRFSLEGRRPVASENTLDSNLEALLAGKPLPFSSRKAVGCAITLR